MKKLIATRSIVADRRYSEGETLELDDKHADPLIACGAAVLAPEAPAAPAVEVAPEALEVAPEALEVKPKPAKAKAAPAADKAEA